MKPMILDKFYLAVVLMLGVSLNAFAGAQTPPTLAGANVVTAEQVKDMMAKGVPVIDARVANEYAEAHIKGAINVPYKEKSGKTVNFDASKDRFKLSKLPQDKNADIIFYCNSGTCWKSYKAATAAVKAGYTKVHWFRGGFPAWKAKGFPIE